MIVKLTMDGANGPTEVVMVRRDDSDKPWRFKVQAGGKFVERDLTDNQAAATAALACGVNLPDDDTVERGLYAMVGTVFDDLAVDLRPIP